MMPLSMMGHGSNAKISKVNGKEEVKRFLAGLGFIPGAEVSVVSDIDGNLIVNIKDSRVAINKDMAAHIMV